MSFVLALPVFLQFLMVGILGLCLGSFATAMSARIPEGRSWIKEKGAAARSACASCKKTLKILNLIPVFSWLIQRGRCSDCHEKISPAYPLIELSTALIVLSAYAVYGWTSEGLLIILMAPFIVALAGIDLKHYILPNQLILILAILGGLRLLIQFPVDLYLEYIAGALLFALLIFMIGKIVSILLKKDALGFGDVKLFAVCGLWLGLSNLPIFLVLCGGFGVIIGGMWRLISRKQIFPFGPAIIASFLVLLLGKGMVVI